MKRLVDGVTYNTETATRLARKEYEGDWNNVSSPAVGELYQTRGGAFFVFEEIEVHEMDRDELVPRLDDLGDRVVKFRFSKCSEAAAKEWIDTGEVEIFLNPFEDKVDEDETVGTIYARVPAGLKRKIEAVAEAEGLSANAWAMRCFEKCLMAD